MSGGSIESCSCQTHRGHLHLQGVDDAVRGDDPGGAGSGTGHSSVGDTGNRIIITGSVDAAVQGCCSGPVRSAASHVQQSEQHELVLQGSVDGSLVAGNLG